MVDVEIDASTPAKAREDVNAFTPRSGARAAQRNFLACGLDGCASSAAAAEAPEPPSALSVPALALKPPPTTAATAASRVIEFTFDGEGPLGILLEETSHGVCVQATQPGSYADQCGLPVGSRIVEILGTSGTASADVMDVLTTAPRPLTLCVEVQRASSDPYMS